MNYREEIERLLRPLPHKFIVRHALAVAKDVYPLARDEDKAIVKACLDTIELWLKGESTAGEVEAAGDKAYAASYAAASAASYASHATYAAYAAYAASHASRAAHTAAYAAHATSSAASHASRASHAASQSYEEEMKKYHSLLIEMIRDVSETERIIWGL